MKNTQTLTRRMRQIVELCPPTRCIADIGCDHGMVAAALAKKCPRVLAADKSAPSLKKAAALGLETRLGDGFEPFAPGELSAAVMAGMGAMLMIDILSRARLAGIEYLVLSPNNYQERLRAWLAENGWRTECERIVPEAGRYYFIMRAVPGEEPPLTPGETETGRYLPAHPSPELTEYLKKRRALLADISRKRGGDPETEQRIAHIDGLLKGGYIR